MEQSSEEFFHDFRQELLASAENTLPTHHPRILIGKTREVDAAFVRRGVDDLIAAAERGDREACRALLRELVPEYVPQA